MYNTSNGEFRQRFSICDYAVISGSNIGYELDGRFIKVSLETLENRRFENSDSLLISYKIIDEFGLEIPQSVLFTLVLENGVISVNSALTSEAIDGRKAIKFDLLSALKPHTELQIKAVA